jgi:hypothetical protein
MVRLLGFAQEASMTHPHAVRRVLGLAALTGALLLLAIPAASAHSRTFVSLGFAFPLYYPPPYYYYPPPVYYVPPPPRVVYAPPPVVSTEPSIVARQTSPTYRRNGQLCREYQSTVVIGGVPRPSYGTACLQPDGAWRVVN